MKLNIQLVPTTCYGSNLRSRLRPCEWNKIRKAVYAKEEIDGKKYCHICGDLCKSLDAHEIWEYDEENHVQKLVDIIGICKPCHNTIHYGRARVTGYEKEAIEQYIKVNKCKKKDLKVELAQAEKNHTRQSKIEDWKLDVTLIEKQGYFLKTII